MFECILCGHERPDSMGADDALERALSDGPRGVCNPCWARLPQHVHEWAKERDADRNTVDELRTWARARIEVCRQQENKFGHYPRETRNTQPPQALIEAFTERRTLQAVLRILEGGTDV